MEDIELDFSREISHKNWMAIIEDFKNSKIECPNDTEKFLLFIRRKYKICLRKSDLIKIYNHLNLTDTYLKRSITKKRGKSHSGILEITILTSAKPEYIDENGKLVTGKFSCKHDCAYCPFEKASKENNWVEQPRSYLFSEPAVLRANQNNFDPILQMNSRISTLIEMGHTADKLEILVLGGTWSEYPRLYQEQFITKTYYAANVFFDIDKRDMKSLEEEIEINEKAQIHIIGLTLETRPDTITLEEIRRFRRYNCTRIQLGVQHTNNDVLYGINRGHTIEEVYDAIKLLKNNCYKIDIHLMPNLPFSNYEMDKTMLEEALYNPRLQVDQYKIYPCAVVPFTKIKKWFEEGTYKPYDDLKLFELIKDFKINVQKYKRLNRIIRDIPSTYISGGYTDKSVNMRQLLQKNMKDENWKCKCIRCREVKDNLVNHDDVKLMIEEFDASDSKEYFISYETEDYLIGFLRLRINKVYDNVLDVIKEAGLIRELHVYSVLCSVGDRSDMSSQHRGYGKGLIMEAERIVKENGLNKMAIISGTGVRDYYRKLGYVLKDTYMIKELKDDKYRCSIQ